jgi:hypothetical protein
MTQLAWTTTLVAAGARLPPRTAIVRLAIDFVLNPVANQWATAATRPTLAVATMAPISVAGGVSFQGASSPLLLRGDASAAVTRVIGPDPRILFPNRN